MFDSIVRFFSSKPTETYSAIVYYKHDTCYGLEEHVHTERITVTTVDREKAIMEANYILNFEKEESGIYKCITDIKLLHTNGEDNDQYYY